MPKEGTNPHDPKQYLTAKNLHCHAPMTGGEICFNYNQLLLGKWARTNPSDISSFTLYPTEKIENWIKMPSPPMYPSDWQVSDLDPRKGHPDNPKYKAEFFDAYNSHGHSPFTGGSIVWNSRQWINRWNFELNLYKQIVPSEIADAISEHFQPVPEPTGRWDPETNPNGIVPYNLHSHSDIEGGVIAQNEWMAKAIENKRIENFNKAAKSDLDFQLEEHTQQDFPFDENVLTGESQKSGTGASGILDIIDPLPSGHTGFVNPAVTAPAFGTEVIFNDRQLLIVLNKLIDLGLIKKPGGGKFTVPDQPTKSYNVHRHSSEFDGGLIQAVGNHAHSGAKDEQGNYEPGENLAYGCFAPYNKRGDDPKTWALYQVAHPE